MTNDYYRYTYDHSDRSKRDIRMKKIFSFYGFSTLPIFSARVVRARAAILQKGAENCVPIEDESKGTGFSATKSYYEMFLNETSRRLFVFG